MNGVVARTARECGNSGTLLASTWAGVKRGGGKRIWSKVLRKNHRCCASARFVFAAAMIILMSRHDNISMPRYSYTLNKSIQQDKKIKNSKIIEIKNCENKQKINNVDVSVNNDNLNHSTNFESEDCIISSGYIEFNQIDFIRNSLLNHFLFKGLSEEIM